MTDLVVQSLEPWDDVWRRNQYLIAGLLAQDSTLRVLFVEPPDDPLHALRRGRVPEFGHGVRRVTDRLWTLRPLKVLPRRLDGRADERRARAVVAAAAKLGMTSPIIWVNDPGAAVVARLSGWTSLYDITDDWLAAERPEAERARIREGEQWLMRNAAAVVACSPELVRRKSDQRDDIVLVQNAVDLARYRMPTTRPADLPIGRAAVYAGTLHRDRLDVELCLRTAAALGAEGTLVLVGPDALPAPDSVALRAGGVMMVGAKSRDEVPAYLQHADALVVPHVVTPFTESLDPLKLYEYRAVGRPVVSTAVAGFRDDPSTVVVDSDGFAAAVTDAMRSSKPFPHGASGRGDDWSARVTRLRSVLDGLR
ncbi:glycosyltransferase family 1 protein [Microbacterium esteraromaticum]|uniref:Glycosyltransferase family 1 protein n=1 Tax=Microbacterium esteraromaticum TaxID=57043 RepID=A0A7D8ALW1_9MICO|nr:glycosyltransferase [Microbacterium esteraromaticum]QMU97408.1 glycosyltransferase family 1 protein [Microbacterium esteraromaticum]